MTTNEIISNRKARYDYEIESTYEAGIVLTGTEIKSLRKSGGSLQDAYAMIREGEVLLYQMHIPSYSHGNIHNHEEKRARKLLLKRREILEFKKQIQIKGYSLIPLSLYVKNGWAKLCLGLAKGKKKHDKRESTKEKEVKRAMQAAMKGR